MFEPDSFHVENPKVVNTRGKPDRSQPLPAKALKCSRSCQRKLPALTPPFKRKNKTSSETPPAIRHMHFATTYAVTSNFNFPFMYSANFLLQVLISWSNTSVAVGAPLIQFPNPESNYSISL